MADGAGPQRLAKGTPVTWRFRGAVEHGYIESFDGIYYHVRQVDNHVATPGPRTAVYKHLPSALTVTTRAAVERAAQAATERRAKHDHGVHEMAQPSKKPDFKPLAKGMHVHWPYRGAIGDGVIEGVDKPGETNDTTRYLVRQLDHHPGESAILKHYGRVLRPGWDHH